MLEPKPKIKTEKQLQRELLAPIRSSKEYQRILDKIRKLKEQRLRKSWPKSHHLCIISQTLETD